MKIPKTIEVTIITPVGTRWSTFSKAMDKVKVCLSNYEHVMINWRKEEENAKEVD